MFRNLLDMTRLEAGSISVKKEWQSVEEIIGAVLDRHSERLKERELSVRIPPDLPLVSFDPLLVEQVLVNLLDNALRYTSKGSPLKLSAEIKEDFLVVELTDQGPGVPPGDEERIFEKFVRGAGGGIGLGLAICRAIVNAHGGRIWAENQPGGALFGFTLPIEGKPPLPGPEEIPESI
jgi:two-component system sensor histidine kinase KdpD